jgi:exodeoxyribonuclease V gamma subunit
MTAAPRAGDRQRRLDDRNLFLDLLLAARERLYLSYTGRSIRDDSVRPPSVLIAELIDTLLPALAPPGDPKALAEARRRLIVEHPLQAFAESYFRDEDPRRRSFNRELCEAVRHALERPASATGESATPAEPDDEAAGGRGAPRFFTAPLAAPGAEWRRVSLDQLKTFFENPCRFLLRQRLGLSLYREDGTVSDEEPFTPDYAARQALAERLLPQAMQGLGKEALRRLAQAGIEYPPGAWGAAALDDEMGSLQRFALAVRDATRAAPWEPLRVELPFRLHGEDWVVSTMITDRRDSGLVLHRYDDTRPRDYLAGWLTHLVAAAASPTPAETRWISRNGEFRFTPCHAARSILEPLLLLYRRGLREPIHFFPKAAWAFIQAGRDLGKAREEWHPNYGGARGEDRHEAYRLALRGVGDPLDDDFKTCADIVFGSCCDYLVDPRP